MRRELKLKEEGQMKGKDGELKGRGDEGGDEERKGGDEERRGRSFFLKMKGEFER